MDTIYTDHVLQPLAANNAREVVFIEDNLSDWQLLSSRLASHAQIIVLDSSQDGLTQVAAHLAARQPGSLDAIHVLSHGAAGQLNLGGSTLTQDTLGQYTWAFNTIGRALSEQGDLLLYGCEVGAGEAGQALVHSIAAFNAERGCQISPDLYVLSDLAGCATVAASGDDYLIPSSILNATVSGLVSRSILNEAIGPADFHGCLFYREFASIDLSQWFIDEVLADIQQLAQNPARAFAVPDRQALAATSARFMADMRARFGIHNENLIKPGIGEATRVLLRRLPERVLVQDPAHPAVQHLLALAAEKAVPVEHDPDLPYAAASLIRSLADA